MNTFDFAPLFRSMIGFDRLASSLEHAYRTEAGGYPPYNVELTDESRYQITLAVAGFSDDEINLEVRENMLVVTGQHKTASKDRQYLYQGIANRSFERKFQLADYVRVTDARLENGLLHIDLEREIPEAMKPRKIAIRSNHQHQGYLEGQSQAANENRHAA